MKKLVIAVLGLALSATSVNAACTTSKMAGKWYFFGDTSFCKVTLSRTGKVIASSCVNEDKNPLTLTNGSVSATSSCQLNGTYTLNGTKIKFVGRTDASQTLIAGVGEASFGLAGIGGFRLP